jgi:hypothetical protein
MTFKIINTFLWTWAQVFDFADGYRGTFTGACPFYCSASGYNVHTWSYSSAPALENMFRIWLHLSIWDSWSYNTSSIYTLHTIILNQKCPKGSHLSVLSHVSPFPSKKITSPKIHSSQLQHRSSFKAFLKGRLVGWHHQDPCKHKRTKTCKFRSETWESKKLKSLDGSKI